MFKRYTNKTGDVCVAICRNYCASDGIQSIAVLLPKEKYGVYANQYNVC